MTGYGARLAAVTAARGALCAGIDPHPGLLDAWGLSRNAAGVERFARTMVDATGDLVAVFKPQSAFFEAYGSAGIAVLERVLADISATGALALLDVKRGDIGSTMDAYAEAYLANGSPLAADAITLSAYLGFGSLRPALELARRTGRGVYVLALTSNPEGHEVQHSRDSSGRTVGQRIVDACAAENRAAENRSEPTTGALGSVGVVVGATIGATGTDFSDLHASILAPGIGAQGGGAADLAAVFGPALDWVLPSLSRELLRAGPDPDRLRAAVRATLGEMSSVIGVG